VTRREAADLLGVSLDTVDRRVRVQTGEGRTPWGAIGLPAASLAELFGDPWPGRGRPESLEEEIVARIKAERRAGSSFAAIAAALNDDGITPAHGGARWWPATVRKVCLAAGARYGRLVADPLEFSTDLKEILAEGARLASREGSAEFGAAHVRRVVDGERAERDSSRDQQGLVQFSEALRDAIAAAQQRAHARGATSVEASDLLAVLH
jgi:hypothetical protein